jgi:hypothetical protein
MNKILGTGLTAALCVGVLAATGAYAAVGGTVYVPTPSVHLSDTGVTPSGATLNAALYLTPVGYPTFTGGSLNVAPSSNTNAFNSSLDVVCFRKVGGPLHVTGTRTNKTGLTAGDITLTCPSLAAISAHGTIDDR